MRIPESCSIILCGDFNVPDIVCRDFRRYRVISNTVHNPTIKDHRDHLEDITKDLIKNPRPFWRWLNNARGHGYGISDLHLSGRVIWTRDSGGIRGILSISVHSRGHK